MSGQITPGYLRREVPPCGATHEPSAGVRKGLAGLWCGVAIALAPGDAGAQFGRMLEQVGERAEQAVERARDAGPRADATGIPQGAAQDSCITEVQRVELLDQATLLDVNKHPGGNIAAWFRAPGLADPFIVALPGTVARDRTVRFIFPAADGRKIASVCTDAWAKGRAYRPPSNPNMPRHLTETMMGDASAQAFYRALVRAKAIPAGRTVTAADLPSLLAGAGKPGSAP